VAAAHEINNMDFLNAAILVVNV